jgi:hypothetical protein
MEGENLKEDAFSVGPSQSSAMIYVSNVALKSIVFDHPFSDMSMRKSKYDAEK